MKKLEEVGANWRQGSLLTASAYAQLPLLDHAYLTVVHITLVETIQFVY